MQRFARHGLRQAYNTTKVKVATYILVQRAMIGQYCVLAMIGQYCLLVHNANQSDRIDKTGYDRLRATYSTTPQLYGLPKIHKPEVPLRPIVSSIGSPTYNLAKFLTHIVSPLSGKTSSFVKDSRDFVEKVRRLRPEEGSILVSFDVTSLFTKVPIAEALEVIGRRLEEQETEDRRTTLTVDSIKQLLHLCLTSTYFM